MNTILRLYVLASLNDDTELHEVSSECDYTFAHPLIKDTEIMGTEEINGSECIEVKVTLAGTVTEAQVKQFTEEVEWSLEHDSIDRTRLMREFKLAA